MTVAIGPTDIFAGCWVNAAAQILAADFEIEAAAPQRGAQRSPKIQTFCAAPLNGAVRRVAVAPVLFWDWWKHVDFRHRRSGNGIGVFTCLYIERRDRDAGTAAAARRLPSQRLSEIAPLPLRPARGCAGLRKCLAAVSTAWPAVEKWMKPSRRSLRAVKRPGATGASHIASAGFCKMAAIVIGGLRFQNSSMFER